MDLNNISISWLSQKVRARIDRRAKIKQFSTTLESVKKVRCKGILLQQTDADGHTKLILTRLNYIKCNFGKKKKKKSHLTYKFIIRKYMLSSPEVHAGWFHTRSGDQQKIRDSRGHPERSARLLFPTTRHGFTRQERASEESSIPRFQHCFCKDTQSFLLLSY